MSCECGADALLAYESNVKLKRENYGNDFAEAQAALQQLRNELAESGEDSNRNMPFLKPAEQLGICGLSKGVTGHLEM